MRILGLAIIVGTLFITFTVVSVHADSSDCASIKDSDERLKCYDKETKNEKARSESGQYKYDGNFDELLRYINYESGENLCLQGDPKRDLAKDCLGASTGEGFCMLGGPQRNIDKDCLGANVNEGMCMAGNSKRTMKDCYGANPKEAFCMLGGPERVMADCYGVTIGEALCMLSNANYTIDKDCYGTSQSEGECLARGKTKKECGL